MPIYAYKCSSCQHELDVLQKISDAPLTVCPNCGASALVKQLTAAGFQLKGSGWYATDFRQGGAKPAEAPGDKPADAKGEAKAAATPDAKAPAAAPAAGQEAAAAPAPAAGGTTA